MNTPTLIGFGGYKESGKDAASDHLVAQHGYTKIGMSDGLLEAAVLLNPLIPIQPSRNLLGETVYAVRLADLVEREGFTAAKRHPEVRRFLQVLGTDVGRDMIDPQVWVNIVADKVLAVAEARGKVALTGVRFPNELEFVHNWGGTSVWVHRPGLVQNAESAHKSESSVKPEDFRVQLHNDSTLEVLYERLDVMMAQ